MDLYFIFLLKIDIYFLLLLKNEVLINFIKYLVECLQLYNFHIHAHHIHPHLDHILRILIN